MIPAIIEKQIQIQAPAAAVWAFVGTEAGLRQWWQADVTLEAKKGGSFSERGVRHGKPYRIDGVVAAYDPPRRLVLLLQSAAPHPDGAVTMTIAITLEGNERQTNVRVIHQIAITLPAVQSQHLAEPEFGQPAGDRPLILNRLPLHQTPAEVAPKTPTRSHANDVTGSDMDLVSDYAGWWTGRMIVLLQMFNRDKETV